MRPYKVTIEVTNAYTVEVHAESRGLAEETASTLDLDQIEDGGDFKEVVNVEVVDAELAYPDEDEEPELETEEDGSDPSVYEGGDETSLPPN